MNTHRRPPILATVLAISLALLLMHGAFAQGGFVGPSSGGPASGTINGNTLTYNGATYQRVEGKVKFPDGSVYVAMDDGALIPAAATPGARTGGIRPDRPSTTGPRPNESGAIYPAYTVEPYVPVTNAGTTTPTVGSNNGTSGPVAVVTGGTPEVGNVTGGTGTPPAPVSTVGHAAVGSYLGKAIQVCPSGVAPSACAGGQPAGVLFMTPTLVSDGLFIADDSLTLLGAPFGPHTTAHGTWTPTSATDFTAEYVFMTRPYPPVASGVAISGLRARWLAKVLDADTLVGWVNAYFQPTVPVVWTPLAENEFPVFPSAANGFVTTPGDFIKDPGTCRTEGCPNVFKFTLKRVRQ